MESFDGLLTLARRNAAAEWLHVFTSAEIADVEQATRHFISLELPFGKISQETFPLTVLKEALAKAVDEIFGGIGLRVLRGLPVQSWDRKVSRCVGSTVITVSFDVTVALA